MQSYALQSDPKQCKQSKASQSKAKLCKAKQSNAQQWHYNISEEFDRGSLVSRLI
jgi:hypothetical protein